MRAAVLEKANTPLVIKEVEVPEPKKGQVRIKVEACAICRTDLHIVDGELKNPKLPLILGHQVVGVVDVGGEKFKKGQKVGAAWLGKSCGNCYFCTHEKENLCDSPEFTGYTMNGGFAEYTTLEEDFIYPISGGVEMAPLLCAGMIGYRSLKMCADAKKIGFYGFGAAAHLLIQVAKFQNKEVYAFTKPGDEKGQKEALKLGAVWAGSSQEKPPEELDEAILFAPVGELVPIALKSVRKGASVVCAGIHMSDIPSFPYSILWGERILRSVANLTRKDGEEFLKLAEKAKVKAEITTYKLEDINKALEDLRAGNISGSAVILFEK